MEATMIQQIFEICIIPLLGILTTYLVKLIQKKSAEIDTKLNDETLKKYNDILARTIEECVLATNQTYVNSLKNRNEFDKYAQKEAFKLTYNRVMSILTEEAKQQLNSVYGDLTVYIATKIEAEVNINKTEVLEVTNEQEG